MFTRRLAISLALTTATASCAGPSQAVPGDGERERDVDADQLLGVTVADLAPGLESDALLRSLRQAVAGEARDEWRRPLRAHAADLGADMLVAARMEDAVDPPRAAWLRDGAGTLFGCDVELPACGQSAADRTYDWLRAAGRADAEATRDVVAAAALGTPLPAPGDAGDPRATLVHLARAIDGFAPWARYDAARAPEALAERLAGAISTRTYRVDRADDLPSTGRRIAESLGDLAELLDAAQAAALAGVPVARAAADAIAADAAMFDQAAVPTSLVPIGVDDPRLAVPASLGPVLEGAALTPPMARTLLVRTDAILLSDVARARVDRDVHVVTVDDGAAGPTPVLTFDGFSLLPEDAVVDGALRAVDDGLSTLEVALLDATWIDPAERRVEESAVPISVIADGEVFFSTLTPLLVTLARGGYAPVVLHTRRASPDSLDAIPISVASRADSDAALLIVRADGYIFQSASTVDLASSQLVRRATPNNLVELVRAVAAAVASGAVGPDTPLDVRVDDNATDYAILVNVLSALAFARADAEGMTDAALLASAPLMDGAQPRPLVPAGLRLLLP